MIQNFERTVPCYNHTVPHPIYYPHQPSSHAVHVSTSNWVSTKKQSTHTAPVAGPSENDSKQTDQNNFSTFDPRIRSVQCSQKGPALDPTAGPLFIQRSPILFNHKPRKACSRKTDSYGHKGSCLDLLKDHTQNKESKGGI